MCILLQPANLGYIENGRRTLFLVHFFRLFSHFSLLRHPRSFISPPIGSFDPPRELSSRLYLRLALALYDAFSPRSVAF